MQAEPGGQHSSAARLPDLNGCETLPEGVCLHLSVPSDLIWLKDHFPTRPVIPGVAQIAWAIAFARNHFDYPEDPKVVERVKFLHPVPLGKPLQLELRGIDRTVTWLLRHEAVTCSSGRLLF